MEKYKIINQVGEGSFGQVFKARKSTDNEIVAFKVIQKCGRTIEELKGLRQECEIQQHLHHPNIIRMLDSFETKTEIVVVTEYADKDLSEILTKSGKLSEERAQVITCELVSALYYLHSNRVLHRDLKPQNVLLDAKGIAKLCDFGFARCMNSNTYLLTSIKGTPLYMAPELIEEYPYDHSVDLWSLGCIIYESVVGSPPFQTSSIAQLVRLIRHETIKWPDYISENCRSFLQGLLQKNPFERLSWPLLLEHPFIKGKILIVGEDLPSSLTMPLSVSQIHEKQYQLHNLALFSPIQNNCAFENNPYYDVHNKQIAYMNHLQYLKAQNTFLPNTPTQYYDNKINVLPEQESKEKDLNSVINNNNLHHFSDEKSTNYNRKNSNEKKNKFYKINLDEKINNRLVDWNPRVNYKPIENDEWMVFLQRSMEEIMNGEINSLLQKDFVSIFIAPLKNPTASCQVIEYISSLLSLPFVLSITSENLNKIQKIYVDVKVVPNLVCAIKLLMLKNVKKESNFSTLTMTTKNTLELSANELQTLESIIVLLCRLVYMKKKFLYQFHDAIYIINGTEQFQSLLNLEKRKMRIVSDLIAILNNVLESRSENIELIENIFLENKTSEEVEDTFKKLVNHQHGTLSSRMFTLIKLLENVRCNKLLRFVGNIINTESKTEDDDVQEDI